MNGTETVIAPDGALDAASVLTLRPTLDALIEAKAGDVAFDFRKVDFIDSSGIGAVVFLHKRLSAQGRAIRVRGLDGQPAELFRFLRIDRAISIETAISA